MIDLHYWPTPNGLKVRLFLEESGLAWRPHLVDIGKGEQFRPAFLAISPNGKIPAIVDQTPADGGAPQAVFESGAILVHLAEKTGRFLARDSRKRIATLQWLFWQVGGLGPMAGQAGHFRIYAPEQVPYGVERYTREVTRLYGVLDRQLDGSEFIADELSIADMACYPWIVPHQAHGQDLEAFSNLRRWFESIRARPATQRVYEGVEDTYSKDRPPLSEQERGILFGPTR